jgi:hypothetical protein
MMSMFNRRTMTTLLIGLVLGAVLAVIARPILGSRLPQSMGGGRESLEGLVTAKQREEDRLLVTIVTPAGATLVTFKKRVAEIALLIDEGDRVTLTLPRYEPFLDDPNITRVVKPDTLAMPYHQPMAPDSAQAQPDSLAEGDSVPTVSNDPWY